MKRFCCGDIHGSAKALVQILKFSNFNYDEDLLICLGDYVDGWSESKEVIDELLKIKNLICLAGNHDDWAYEYYTSNNLMLDMFWKNSYGKETIKSLGEKNNIDKKYIQFFENMLLYYEIDNKLFVHAEPPAIYYNYNKCDRSLFNMYRDRIKEAYINRNVDNYIVDNRWEEIYVGHTPISNFDKKYDRPQKWCNMWAVDTGCAFDGKLSIINIDTKEIFQSNESKLLYPYECGRNKKSYYDSINK